MILSRRLGYPKDRSRPPLGFTFIELMVALVVFGILVSMAYVRVGPALGHARVNRAATVLATDLQYAQLMAVRRRQPVAVITDGSVRFYIIRLRNSAVPIRQRFFGQDTEYVLDQLTASPASVDFFPNGVAATAATFTLGLGGYTRTVRLTRGGQVRIVP